LSINSLTAVCSFLRQHLGSSGPETADVEALKLEVTDLRQKVEKLSDENAELKQKVCGLFLLYFSVTCLFIVTVDSIAAAAIVRFLCYCLKTNVE